MNPGGRKSPPRSSGRGVGSDPRGWWPQQCAAWVAGRRLPLPNEYRQMLDSGVADLRNVGTGGYGGALTAGLFLKEFTGTVPWAHLDIAGPARASSDDAYITKGGTGFGVRTLVEL